MATELPQQFQSSFHQTFCCSRSPHWSKAWNPCEPPNSSWCCCKFWLILLSIICVRKNQIVYSLYSNPQEDRKAKSFWLYSILDLFYPMLKKTGTKISGSVFILFGVAISIRSPGNHPKNHPKHHPKNHPKIKKIFTQFDPGTRWPRLVREMR